MESEHKPALLYLAILALFVVVSFQQKQLWDIRSQGGDRPAGVLREDLVPELSSQVSPLELEVETVSGREIVGTARYSVFEEGTVVLKTKKLTLVLDEASRTGSFEISNIKPRMLLVAVLTKESPEQSSRLTVVSMTVTDPNPVAPPEGDVNMSAKQPVLGN